MRCFGVSRRRTQVQSIQPCLARVPTRNGSQVEVGMTSTAMADAARQVYAFTTFERLIPPQRT
jgi:hypothetical protein